MKRLYLLCGFFIVFLLSFVWYRWQPMPSIQPVLNQYHVEVASIEKAIWPALTFQDIAWRNITVPSLTVSPVWWSFLRFSPALQFEVDAFGAQQRFKIGQSGDLLQLTNATLQLPWQDVKDYMPMAAMLPIEGSITASMDGLLFNPQDMMLRNGTIVLQTQNVQLLLGDQPEALPSIQLEVVWQKNMWHWTIVSDIIKGEGLIQQVNPIAYSTISGKINIEKNKLPSAIQVFLPAQKDQLTMSVTGTVAVPSVTWL